MTKRDYERTAGILETWLYKNERKFVAKAFALWFSEDNHRFDERKFLDACGLPDVPVSEDK